MSIKVGPLDLLEANDLCVEGQGTPHVRDNDGNVFTLRMRSPPCHAAESQDSNEGEVLVTGMIREMASPSERGPRTSRGPPKHCR